MLAYHRVATLDVDPWDLAVSPTNFADQLAELRDRGTVRRLGDLLDDSPAARVRAVRAQFAVTFDDGYVDNLETALPILESFDAAGERVHRARSARPVVVLVGRARRPRAPIGSASPATCWPQRTAPASSRPTQRRSHPTPVPSTICSTAR